MIAISIISSKYCNFWVKKGGGKNTDTDTEASKWVRSQSMSVFSVVHLYAQHQALKQLT